MEQNEQMKLYHFSLLFNNKMLRYNIYFFYLDYLKLPYLYIGLYLYKIFVPSLFQTFFFKE